MDQDTSYNGKGALHQHQGRYLLFSLSSETYAMNILKVEEIFGLCEITRVPKCPEFLKGVINLRGKIIPVVDLRLKFQFEPREYDARTCIVVVKIKVGEQTVSVGLIVDRVLEVVDFKADDLANHPQYNSQLNDDFILSMGTFGDDEVVILIDIEMIFSEYEKGVLSEHV